MRFVSKFVFDHFLSFQVRRCILLIEDHPNEVSREVLRYISRKDRGVRKTLLMGVFWCILIIEAILLIGTLLYEAVSGDLKQDLLHYPHGGKISGQLRTVNSFSTLLIKDMYDRGKRFHLRLLFSLPLFKFLEIYVLKRSFKDGLLGLIIAVSDAYAMFVRHVKLREIR